MSADFTAKVDKAAEAMLEGGKPNGVTAVHVAVSDGKDAPYTKAYGTVSTGGAAASIEDSFPIGSITKTFTATTILKLVEEGKLKLTDTVATILPDLAKKFPKLADLTVQQLLSMTSGIPDYLNVPNSVVAEITKDTTKVWTPEELIAGALKGDVQPAGTPGYSTTNFIILQLMAESLTGESLAKSITADVTTPLGLSHTFLPDPAKTALPDPHTHGYVAGGCVDEFTKDGGSVASGTDTTDWNTSFTQGGGGMVSTIGDQLKWAESVSGNSLLKDDLAEQRAKTDVDLGGYKYGLGLLSIGSWVGHEGEAVGWEALSVTDPATGTSVALAANGCGGLVAGFATFLDTLYPDGKAMETLTGGPAPSAEASSTGSPAPDGSQKNQVIFLVGDKQTATTWSACPWDGKKTLKLESSGDGINIHVTTAADGSFPFTIDGKEKWSGTVTGQDTGGQIAATGKGKQDGGKETDVALLIDTSSCS